MRATTADADAFEMAIAAFDLPTLLSAEGEGAWSLHAIPAAVQGEKAFQTLQLLLGQAGVETAIVVEREDGSLGALRPVADIAWRPEIPQSWRASVVESVVTRWAAAHGLSWDGNRCVLTLDSLPGAEFLRVVAALAARPEIERIEPQVDPIGVPLEGIPATDAAVSVEGEIKP